MMQICNPGTWKLKPLSKAFLIIEKEQWGVAPKKEKVAVGVIKQFALIGVFILSASQALAQIDADTTKTPRESKIDALLSFYGQNGKHAAVTGGKGSENLQVYSVKINGTHKTDSINTYYLSLGVDVISSASTDSIDFIVSSASRVDQHTSLSLGYSRQLSKELSMGAQFSLSLESDYFSRGGEIWLDYLRKDQRAAATLNVSAYFDDLRWGRLQPPYLIEARNLIYPVELRDSAWFDIYNRNSYNISGSYRYDLNKRMSLSFFPAYSYQEGLLSTPFHRIYFQDKIRPEVENLPRKKHMGVLGVQLNSFIGGNFILRSYAQYYMDDFGLTSASIKLEAPIKIKPTLTVAPSFRYANQTASDYFKPYREHLSSEEFFTSDYDLSAFWSINPGVSFNFWFGKPKNNRWQFQKLSLRYSYYQREDGLNAHIISTYFGLESSKAKK